MDAAPSCRCCLRRAPDRDLTTPYTHLGTTEIYSDMLKECFEIHLILDSEKEVGICDVCVGRLRDASNFKLQVQRSQVELYDAWLQGAPQVKEEKPAVQSIMEDGDGCSEEPVLCEGAPIKTELKTEDETSGEESQELFQDGPAVGAGAVNGGARNAILPILYEARAVKAEVLDDEEEDCISRCPGASADLEPARAVSARAREQLASGPRLVTRMTATPDDTAGLRAEEQAYTRDTCGEHFTDNSRLIKHIQEHATYCCKICPSQFSSKRALVIHKRTHMKKKAFPCEICNKQFSSKYSLMKHVSIHTGRKLYCCDICDKQFTRTGNLKRHNEEVHTRDKRYICDTCHEQFTRKSRLTEHIRTHTRQRPYTCDVCSKRFAERSTLTEHQRIHTGEKPHTCNICDKPFTQKSSLTKHIRTHTGQRPYTCDVCSKTFICSSSLRVHKRIHTGEKPYTCNVCDKKFARKDHLTDHIRTHRTETLCLRR